MFGYICEMLSYMNGDLTYLFTTNIFNESALSSCSSDSRIRVSECAANMATFPLLIQCADWLYCQSPSPAWTRIVVLPILKDGGRTRVNWRPHRGSNI